MRRRKGLEKEGKEAGRNGWRRRRNRLKAEGRRAGERSGGGLRKRN